MIVPGEHIWRIQASPRRTIRCKYIELQEDPPHWTVRGRTFTRAFLHSKQPVVLLWWYLRVGMTKSIHLHQNLYILHDGRQWRDRYRRGHKTGPIRGYGYGLPNVMRLDLDLLLCSLELSLCRYVLLGQVQLPRESAATRVVLIVAGRQAQQACRGRVGEESSCSCECECGMLSMGQNQATSKPKRSKHNSHEPALSDPRLSARRIILHVKTLAAENTRTSSRALSILTSSGHKPEHQTPGSSAVPGERFRQPSSLVVQREHPWTYR